MDFVSAEQQFRSLEQRRQAGALDEAAYSESVNALRVTDDLGRVWMMQERTGRWYVWESGAWQAAEPQRPVSAPPPPVAPPASVPPPVPPAMNQFATDSRTAPPVTVASAMPAAPAAPAVSGRGTNGLGFVLPLFLWAALFGALGYVAVNNGGVEQDGLLIMGGAAVVALILILWRLTREYEGIIEKLRVEEVTDTDDDGSTSTKHVTFAYIRTLEGKVKKIPARRGYAQGDRLYKRKGDWNARKAKA